MSIRLPSERPDFARPVCARCHRDVDRITVSRDELARTYSIAVACHGDVETVRLADAEIAGASRVSLGIAFAHAAPALAVPLASRNDGGTDAR